MSLIFNINKGSTLPTLRMSLTKNGRYNYQKIFYALQNCDVYFTMIDKKSGIKKIARSKCSIVKRDYNTCEEEFIIQYNWNARDTNMAGVYRGLFDIEFKDDLKVEGFEEFSSGTLTVPISEELTINIIEGSIAR